MLVSSQLTIQTTKIFCSFLNVRLCPHFEKGSATHDVIMKQGGIQLKIFGRTKLFWTVFSSLQYTVRSGSQNLHACFDISLCSYKTLCV